MDADRNFRFGLMAVRRGLIDPGQLVEAGEDWLACPERPLAQVLGDRGWLSDEEVSTVEHELDDEGRSTHPDDSSRADSPSELSTKDWSPSGGSAVAAGLDDEADGRGFGSRYRDLRLHACGGLGRVWRAWDSVLGREVALKDLRPERAFTPGLAARFLEEARVTAGLEHPNIVPVHDLSEWTERPFYSMRLLGDRTLKDAVRDHHRKDGGGARRRGSGRCSSRSSRSATRWRSRTRGG